MKLTLLVLVFAAFVGFSLACSLVFNQKRYSLSRVIALSVCATLLGCAVIHAWPGFYPAAVALGSYWFTLWFAHRKLLKAIK